MAMSTITYRLYFIFHPVRRSSCSMQSFNKKTMSDQLVIVPFKLEKRAARIVLRADIMTPSETMFRELSWLPFYVQYHTYILMYKPLNNSAPEYGRSGRFIKISETHDRNLRSVDSGLLKVPYSRTRYYDNFFLL